MIVTYQCRRNDAESPCYSRLEGNHLEESQTKEHLRGHMRKCDASRPQLLFEREIIIIVFFFFLFLVSPVFSLHFDLFLPLLGEFEERPGNVRHLNHGRARRSEKQTVP